MGYRYRRSGFSYRFGRGQSSKRAELANDLRGIDKDIERIFLSLSDRELDAILRRYAVEHGSSAANYARTTYLKWRNGSVRMSGRVAERLIALVPPLLSTSVRFDLIKKLRAAYLERVTVYVRSSPDNWQSEVMARIQAMVNQSASFKLPESVLSKACWLTDGDGVAAQKLLVAAEQEEAAIRLAFLDEEFRRIGLLLVDVDAHRKVSHTISLPHGDIVLNIEAPPRTLFQKILDWLR